MPTSFTSGRFAGALTVVGALTAGVVALTTLTVTTGTFTTLGVTGVTTVKTLSVTGTETAQNLTVTGALIGKTFSGSSTLTLSPLGDSPTFKVLCPKAGGVIGTMTVTATGTVLKTCN